MSQLPSERIRLVLDAWIDRSAGLAEAPHVEQVFCFENRGEEIGVTLGHPHGQIYGYPFVTPRTRAMAEAARRHRDRTGGDTRQRKRDLRGSLQRPSSALEYIRATRRSW